MGRNYHDDYLLVEQDDEMEDEFEDTEEWEDEEAEEGLWIEIDGERYGITNVWELGPSVVAVETDIGRAEFILAENSDEAATLVVDRWKAMGSDELAEMIGVDRIVDMWTNGESFDDFLQDMIAMDGPASDLASYDGEERDVDEVSPDFVEEVGFQPEFAYRSN